MTFNNTNIEVFLRNILFSSDAPRDLKEEAFNILIEATVIESRKRVALPIYSDVLIPDSTYTEIVRLLKDNRRIEAIKVLRTETGLGLKESKDVVDAILPPPHLR